MIPVNEILRVKRRAVNPHGREGAPKDHAKRTLKLMELASVTTQNQLHKKRGNLDCMLLLNPVSGQLAVHRGKAKK